MIVPYEVDTKDPRAVCTYVRTAFVRVGWGQNVPLLEQVFTDVARLFTGAFPGYLAIDMAYHDFQHTLQATVCLTDIIQGRHRARALPELSGRDAVLAVTAALLHDSGFLKRTEDPEGTGAKYTLVHERRSCDFARTYLPTLGVKAEEIEDVCAAISCTGPRNRIAAHTFRRPEARTMACILMTADYLAQMSAADYPDKLQVLFREFEEAFEFEGVAAEKRPYHDVRELFLKTPDFWRKFVHPMLEADADGVYHFLSNTGQPNLYVEAVEANMVEIQRRLHEGLVRV